ncbi:hypothetical protein [Brevundimonas sp.]|uniref:hypothetical protein n=1 Tax=Brevundimonas sp. TaxID=1871086 RepID=UPI003AF4B80B
MFKILIPAVAALGLVAHAAQSYTAEDGVTAAPVIAAAATSVDAAPSAPAMDWHFHSEGDTAKLAYGVANSDQLVLMLTCQTGQDMISALGSVRTEAETATEQTSYRDPMTGGILHEAEINRHDAALADLAATGKMTVVSDQGKVAIGSDATDQEAVKAFFASCGSAPA